MIHFVSVVVVGDMLSFLIPQQQQQRRQHQQQQSQDHMWRSEGQLVLAVVIHDHHDDRFAMFMLVLLSHQTKLHV